MRNYSHNAKTVVDYNVNKKIQLEDFYKNSNSHLEEIGAEFIKIRHEKKKNSLFSKMKKDLSVENILTILSLVPEDE